MVILNRTALFSMAGRGAALIALLVACALGISPMAVAAAAAPPMGGTMSVEARPADEIQNGSTDNIRPENFRDAAVNALSQRGFTLLEGTGHAAYSMELIIRTSQVGSGDARVAPSSPSFISGGAAKAAGSIFKLPIPSGKSRLVPLERTQLDMVVRKRGETEAVWRGAAVTVRSAGAPGDIASDLCGALLRAYPAQSDAVIGVP